MTSLVLMAGLIQTQSLPEPPVMWMDLAAPGAVESVLPLTLAQKPPLDWMSTVRLLPVLASPATVRMPLESETLDRSVRPSRHSVAGRVANCGSAARAQRAMSWAAWPDAVVPNSCACADQRASKFPISRVATRARRRPRDTKSARNPCGNQSIIPAPTCLDEPPTATNAVQPWPATAANLTEIRGLCVSGNRISREKKEKVRCENGGDMNDTSIIALALGQRFCARRFVATRVASHGFARKLRDWGALD